jgi:hypothetical protein
MTPTALVMLAQLPTVGPVVADNTHAPVATAATPPPTRDPTKDRASPSPTAETIPTVVGGVQGAARPATRTAVSPLRVVRTPSPALSSPTTAPTVNAGGSLPGSFGFVGNTGGEGTYLRHSALHSDQWLPLADGTRLVFLGSQAERDNDQWLWVSDPLGNVGWVESRYYVASL